MHHHIAPVLNLSARKKKDPREGIGCLAGPTVISGRGNPNSFVDGADNIIAALEQP